MKFLKILSKKICKFAKKIYIKEHQNTGEVAQLARASHWQCEGRGFESLFLHQNFLIAKDLQIKSLAIFFL